MHRILAICLWLLIATAVLAWVFKQLQETIVISIVHAAQAVQRTVEQHPVLNWTIIIGSAALSWIQAVAGLVAIVWGGLQIYLAVEKRWFRKDKR